MHKQPAYTSKKSALITYKNSIMEGNFSTKMQLKQQDEHLEFEKQDEIGAIKELVHLGSHFRECNNFYTLITALIFKQFHRQNRAKIATNFTSKTPIQAGNQVDSNLIQQNQSNQ